MRVVLVVALAVLLLAPAASAATEQRRESTFAMARDFDDRLTVVSGAMEFGSPSQEGSTAFFRVAGVEVGGLTRACWQVAAALPPECADGPLKLVVPRGSSFGYNLPDSPSLEVSAGHALATFVDLSSAEGFDGDLGVRPSVLLSMVDSKVDIGSVASLTEASPGWFTALEGAGVVEVRTTAGIRLHTLRANDPPLAVEGRPAFTDGFAASVAILPFGSGSSADFRPAAQEAAVRGLSAAQLGVLDDVLDNVGLVGADAKEAPFAILEKADDILNEVFNGAFLRTSLADDPGGLGDVAFAKFDELSITDGAGRSLDFDGSYTLVVGDLGPSFDNTEISQDSWALRWWVGLFALAAIVVVGAWLWLREGRSLPRAEPGPQTMFARIATVVGVVIAFLVWDWQLEQVLGSSLLTSEPSGSTYGLLILLEFASLALAGVLIGVPVYFATRYGLALAKQPRYTSLAATAAVFFTIAFGVYLLPALVSFIASLAA